MKTKPPSKIHQPSNRSIKKLVGKLVVYKRAFGSREEHGFLVDSNSQFVAISRLIGDFIIDGHAIFEISSLRYMHQVDPDSIRSRACAVLRLVGKPIKHQWATSWHGIFQNIGDRIVVIYRERRYDDACLIGYVDSLTSHNLMARLVDTEGRLDDETTQFRLKSISRIGVGGRYESTLEKLAPNTSRADKRKRQKPSE